MMKYTFGYIRHNEDVFNQYLEKSLSELEGDYLVISTDDTEMPAKNYNHMLSMCQTKYLILTHQDISFSKNLLLNIDRTIEEIPNDFGGLCLVGVDSVGNYYWSEEKISHQVSISDACFILINTENKIKFNEDIFNEFHLYVEDYCAQMGFEKKSLYTILTSSNVNFKESSYILHHGHTVSQRGFFWGNYNKYKKIFNDKWPNTYTT